MKLKAYFDPNDEELLDRAIRTGQPPDVFAAILHAAREFEKRLAKHRPFKPLGDRLVLDMCKPATAFDRIVVRGVLQAASQRAGRIISVRYHNQPGDGHCPDVEFLPPHERGSL